MGYEHRKGYEAEFLIQEYLRDLAPDCYRPRAGSHDDVGDIVGLPIVISVKNHVALDLGTWMKGLIGMLGASGKELGVVWHKRMRYGHPRDWYVTMSGATFYRFLAVYMREVTGNVALPSNRLHEHGSDGHRVR